MADWTSFYHYLDHEAQEEFFYSHLKAHANAAINYFQDQARRELRYTFRGKIVPIEIENLLKFILKRSLKNEAFPIFTDNQIGKTFKILDFEKTKKDDGSFLYLVRAGVIGTHNTYTFWVKEIKDKDRGRYPIWEIHYNDQVYREIPRHGNVFSHTKYQQEHIEKSSEMDYRWGIITLAEKRLMDTIHPIHDIDEIHEKKSDIEDTKKWLHDYQDDGTLLEMLRNTGLSKNKHEEQMALMLHCMLQRVDGPFSVFKAYERIQYFKNALDIHKTWSYYNHQEYLAGDILSNYMHIFVKNEPKIYIPFTGSNQDIQKYTPVAHKPLTFPSIRSFFINHRKEIDEVFQQITQDNKKYINMWLDTQKIQGWKEAWLEVKKRIRKKDFD